MGRYGLQEVLSDYRLCDGPISNARSPVRLEVLQWADIKCKECCKIRGRAMGLYGLQEVLSD